MGTNVLDTFKRIDANEGALNDAVGVTVIDESLLGMVAGGHPESWGFFFSISAECLKSGNSCNPADWFD